MKTVTALLVFLASLQSALATSRYVTLAGNNPSETVLPTDLIEIVGSMTNTRVKFDQPDGGSYTLRFNETDQLENNISPVGKHIFTGAVQVSIPNGGVATLKITPAATTTTTSKPVVVPPTSVSDDTVNIQLQVSTDLKNWEDVAPGEFLGSDTMRFFRIKATSGGAE